MSRVIYVLAEHSPRMTPDEHAMLSDIDVWEHYLQERAASDSRGSAETPSGFEWYRSGLEAHVDNVYEYELINARIAYRHAFEHLTGAQPHFMTFVQLTIAELRRLEQNLCDSAGILRQV